MSKKKEVKTNAMRFLDKNKIYYETVTYRCEEFTDGLRLAESLGIPAAETYKTLVTTGKTGEHYVFVIPVDKELDLKKAAKSVGEKSIEMLHLKDITKVTGYVRGGCSPLGMKKQLPTVIQKEAKDLASFYVSGGRLGSQIKASPGDLVKAIDGKFDDVVISLI
ncbi:MAG: Cys-tRNA(Pro) deacylase [Bacillota bacterium]|nr:Cys-tRNA(Pro) deacylase [Bacillota bacterium]